jgi:putative MATE family efflux protein
MAVASAPSAQPLLTAPVLPMLWRLAVPNMVAMVGSAVAAIAETAYVGQLGVSALAGMALVFPLLMLQQMFSGGAMGGSIASLVSRALGAGNVARAEALVVHALGIAVVAGLVTTVAMLTLSDAVFGLLGGRGEPLAQAVAYAHVAFLGSAGVWLLNTLSAVLRATGNMLVPSVILIAVGLVQVALAGVFGLGAGPIPRLGMPGIALGQVLAYAGGTLVLGWYLYSGKARIRLRLRGATWQPALARDLLQLGAKACASPVQTIGTMMILTWLVARSGPQALAGYGIGVRLEFLLVPLAFSFGAASVPLIGMAIGAGQVARARQVGWAAAAMAGLLLGIAGLVLAVVPDLWTDRFTQDPAVLAAADTYFHWAGPFYALYGAGLSLYSSAIAANRVGGQVLAGTLRLLLVGLGGAALVAAQAPAWAIFALVAVGMAAYGTASILLVRYTPWEPPLRPAPA